MKATKALKGKPNKLICYRGTLINCVGEAKRLRLVDCPAQDDALAYSPNDLYYNGPKLPMRGRWNKTRTKAKTWKETDKRESKGWKVTLKAYCFWCSAPIKLSGEGRLLSEAKKDAAEKAAREVIECKCGCSWKSDGTYALRMANLPKRRRIPRNLKCNADKKARPH